MTDLLHLSDPHVTIDPLYGSLDGAARLVAAAKAAHDSGFTPEAVIVSGDLVDRSEQHRAAGLARYLEARVAVRELLGGVPVIDVLGNHDGVGDLEAIGVPARSEADREASCLTSRPVGECRVVALSLPGGELDETAAARLATALAEPHAAPLGTVIVLHHPPVASLLPSIADIHLRGADLFWRAIADSDARLVLAGHQHHAGAALRSGVLVSAAPALSYAQAPSAGPRRVAGIDQAGFSLVRISADGIDVAALALEAGPPLFTLER